MLQLIDSEDWFCSTKQLPNMLHKAQEFRSVVFFFRSVCSDYILFLFFFVSVFTSGVSAGDLRGRVSAVVGRERDAEGEEAAGLCGEKWENQTCSQNSKGEQ